MEEDTFTLTVSFVLKVPLRYRDGALLTMLGAAALECDVEQAHISAFSHGAMSELGAVMDRGESGYYTLT